MLAQETVRHTIFVFLSSLVIAVAALGSESRGQTPLMGQGSSRSLRSAPSHGFVPRHQRPPTGLRVAQAMPAHSGGSEVVSPIIAADLGESIIADPSSAPQAIPSASAVEILTDETFGLESDQIVGGEEGCSCSSCDAPPGWGPQVLPGFWMDHLSFEGGVHGFKSPANRGEDGSFGFHTGLNYGTPARNILLPPSIGWQVGFEANFSNFEGASFTPSDRKQYFFTTGVFRRGDYGLQGGLVWDYLWDEWYYDLAVGQLRGELSLAMSEHNTWGVWFASAVSSDSTTSQVADNLVEETWETTDIVALFYRSRLLAAGTGEGRLFGGLTGDGDGLIGANSKLPLHNGWALETDFTYLIPKEDVDRFEREAWNVAINLVWYPGSLACGSCVRYHRPLFDVADNGSMILRRKD